MDVNWEILAIDSPDFVLDFTLECRIHKLLPLNTKAGKEFK